jgi:hypothetical protein
MVTEVTRPLAASIVATRLLATTAEALIVVAHLLATIAEAFTTIVETARLLDAAAHHLVMTEEATLTTAEAARLLATIEEIGLALATISTEGETAGDVVVAAAAAMKRKRFRSCWRNERYTDTAASLTRRMTFATRCSAATSFSWMPTFAGRAATAACAASSCGRETSRTSIPICKNFLFVVTRQTYLY